MNFYRRFIKKYSKLVVPLSDMLKGSKNSKKKGPFVMTDEAKKAFKGLKEAFTKAPVTQHHDPDKLLQLETDSLGYAIAGILSQSGGELVEAKQSSREPARAKQSKH